MNSPHRRLRILAGIALAAALAGCGGSAVGSTVPSILFSPFTSNDIFLVTLDGHLLHQWHTDFAPGYSVYLLPTGKLLRANSIPGRPFSTAQGSNGGRVEMLDWNSNVVWRFDYATTAGQQHHDVFYMPTSGHVLMVAWEQRLAAEAIAAGRDPDTIPSQGDLWVDTVAEVDPATSQVVWQWRTWDHLLPPGAEASENPGLIDPNFAAARAEDWTHANAVFYNATLDQVMLSVRNFSEFWVIDHSTTTAQAAGHTGGRTGHGGDLIYRWGNPRAYGLDAPQQLYGQHNAQWIASGLTGAGDILVFNNGDVNARPYSLVTEIVPPVHADGSYDYDPVSGFLPRAPTWQYMANPPSAFFAPIISGAQRLASGNTLVTVGTEGRMFEVTPDGQTVWSYAVTDTAGGTGYYVFRGVRYEAGYEGLAGQTLVPGELLRIPPAPLSSSSTRQSY